MTGTSSGCRTVFLGNQRPLLHSTVEFLLAESGQGPWDLGDTLLVLPTRTAAGRLVQLIEQAAARHGRTLRPPRVITVGSLPADLHHDAEGEPPLADPTEQTLAWTAALRGAANDTLRPLFPSLSTSDPLQSWTDLAATLQGLHEDLASAELSFSDVASAIELDQAAERRRWQLLQALFDDYLEQLRVAGRRDPLEARRRAIAEGRCRSEASVVLVGTTDLSRSLTTMLRAVAQAPGAGPAAVTALIAADAARRDHFDPFGTVIASRWLEAQLPLGDDQLVAADDAVDSASAAVAWVESLLPALPPGRITVGVTDESLVAPLEFELWQAGLASFRELGWTLDATPVGRFLDLLADLLNQRTWQSLAAFVRHDDVHRWLETQLPEPHRDSRWLVALDELLAEHYPTRLAEPLAPRMLRGPSRGPGAAAALAAALAAAEAVRQWLAPLDEEAMRTIVGWAQPLSGLIQQLFDQAVAAADDSADIDEADTGRRRLSDAVATSRRVLHQLGSLAPALDAPVPLATGLDLIRGRLAGVRVFDPRPADAIRIAGWLDLPLDDGDALVVVGFNHPFVPESVSADPFLPGMLRGRLGAGDNERRLARDIQATELLASTREHLRLVVGRRAIDGSPTPPSRLLGAAESDAVARRLVGLLADDAGNRRRRRQPRREHRWAGAKAKTELPIPVLDPSAEVKVMSVTSFASYLACPYRFYLRHVLRLVPIDDSSTELAANQFGDLIHNSLEQFGLSSAKDETDERKIEAAMFEALDHWARDYFGTTPAPAVRLQIDQARLRLKAVAQAQAQWRRAGWRIWKVEASVSEEDGAGIDVDGRRMFIRGRFDRIDYNDDGQWVILDYKTHGHPPRKKHLQKDPFGVARWVELQLPIYRLMIPYLVGDEIDPSTVSLAYFNVADKAAETRVNIADFTPEEFADAEQVIRSCIRGIWAGRFQPSDAPVPFDDYAMILQAEVAERMFDSDAVTEEPW